MNVYKAHFVCQSESHFTVASLSKVLLLGFFWPRAMALGVFGVLIGTIVFKIVLKFDPVIEMSEIRFVMGIWIVFMACLTVATTLSFCDKSSEPESLSNLAKSSLRRSP